MGMPQTTDYWFKARHTHKWVGSHCNLTVTHLETAMRCLPPKLLLHAQSCRHQPSMLLMHLPIPMLLFEINTTCTIASKDVVWEQIEQHPFIITQ